MVMCDNGVKGCGIIKDLLEISIGIYKDKVVACMKVSLLKSLSFYFSKNIHSHIFNEYFFSVNPVATLIVLRQQIAAL